MVLTGRKILVTGGCGFIGSHLVEYLVNTNSNVIVPYQSIDPKSYFVSKGLDKKVLLTTCDLKDFKRVRDIISKYEVDYIFHLAAQPLVNVAYNNPVETYETNIMGTINILEGARLYGKTLGILVTSSDKAYGKIPRASEKNFIGGDHPYESSKAAADLIATTYSKTYRMPIVVTRFGNVYGEGDLSFSRIIPGIMRSVILGDTLKVRSNGKFIRDYVYVGDVVEAMIKLVINIKKVQGEAFNISSLENLSVVDVIKKIESILSLKIKYKIQSVAINEIPTQSVNFNKIRKTFGWQPKNNFVKTSSEIFAWYKSYFEGVE